LTHGRSFISADGNIVEITRGGFIIFLKLKTIARILLFLAITGSCVLAQSVSDNLKKHVHKLSAEIGNRSVYSPGAMTEAELYIKDLFENFGYTVELQDCKPLISEDEDIKESDFIAKNIIATREGKKGQPQIIIGAHYDTCDNPGANDNASGVAVMLELAGKLKDIENNLTVRFIAFANEEPPFYETETMGSMIYTAAASAREDDIKGVIILDGVGYYPHKSNYVYIAGNQESMIFAGDVKSIFSKNSSFPVKIMKPGTDGYDESDHWSFWNEGYNAVMFIGSFNDFDDPLYHSPQDTEEKLNYHNMSLLVEGLSSVIKEMVR
jgi:aminopeptidase-like protein